MQQKSEERQPPVEKQTARPLTPLQRVLQASTIETERSPGEVLMPFFLALAEMCWFNGVLIGLAGVDFLHTRSALLPFWGAPLLLCVSLWLFQRGLYQPLASSPEQEENTRVTSGNGLFFGVLAVLAVVMIWLHGYAGSYFLLDPRWLLSLGNDLLSLNDHLVQTVAILVITAYLCWRGSKLAQLRIEPGHIKRQIWLGLLVLLASILLRASLGRTGGVDDIVMLLLPPAFLYFALSAHALARASFMRRSHPFGLEGTIATQERSMLSIIGMVGLVLLALTLISSVAFSAAFWSSLQPAGQTVSVVYTWLVDKVSMALAWVLQPLFWLIDWVSTLFHPTRKPAANDSHTSQVVNHRAVITASPVIVFAVKILLPLAIALVLGLLIWLALRRRKRVRATHRRVNGDVHESLWSWALFWHQLKALLASLFRRRQAAAETPPVQSEGELPTEAAARTIREIYRALLKQAASAGYVRRRHETPHEFRLRLNQLRPTDNEPQLGQITEAYALIRYGGNAPDERELTDLRRSWQELEGKWRTPAERG